MKPKDYINKKAQEEAIKAFGATQLNSTQEAGTYFVGKINASRTKITDPNGKEYDLAFTGNPKEYELAQRLSDSKAVVNAQLGTRMNVDGGSSKEIIIYTDSSGTNSFGNRNWYLKLGNNESNITSHMNSLEIKTSEQIQEDFADYTLSGATSLREYVKISRSGKHMAIIKVAKYTLFQSNLAFSYVADVQSTQELGNNCGTFAGNQCLELITTYTYNMSNAYYDLYVNKVFTSYKILYNFNIDTESNLTYTKSKEIINTELFESADDFPASGQSIIINPDVPSLPLLGAYENGSFLSGGINPGGFSVDDIYFDVKGNSEELIFLGWWNATNNSVITWRGLPTSELDSPLCVVNIAQQLSLCSGGGPLPQHSGPLKAGSIGVTSKLTRGLFIKKLLPSTDSRFVIYYQPEPLSTSTLGSNQGFPGQKGTNFVPYLSEDFQVQPQLWKAPIIVNNGNVICEYDYSFNGDNITLKGVIVDDSTVSNSPGEEFPGTVNVGNFASLTQSPAFTNNLTDFIDYDELNIEGLAFVYGYTNRSFIGICVNSFEDYPEVLNYSLIVFEFNKNSNNQFPFRKIIRNGKIQNFTGKYLQEVGLRAS